MKGTKGNYHFEEFKNDSQTGRSVISKVQKIHLYIATQELLRYIPLDYIRYRVRTRDERKKRKGIKTHLCHDHSVKNYTSVLLRELPKFLGVYLLDPRNDMGTLRLRGRTGLRGRKETWLYTLLF